MTDDDRAGEALAALQAMNTERIEYKADVTPAVLDIENRDVTTLFSVDNLDSTGDITEVSAFKRSLDHRAGKIPHLYMHDLNQPAIARILSFQPLKRLELPTDVQQEHPEATGGMACVSRYLKSGRGAEVYEGIKEGIPYQASFGYQVVASEPEPLPGGRKGRRIKELRLFEVSTTAPGHAANSATRTRLNKVYAAFEELKMGWRHGRHSDTTGINALAAQLQDMLTELISMGATAITLIEPAPQLTVARTSNPVDDLLKEVMSLYPEVPHVSVRLETQNGHETAAGRAA